MDNLDNDAYLQSIINLIKDLSKALENPILGIKSLTSEHLYITQYLINLWNIDLSHGGDISIWPNYSLLSTYQDDQEIIRSRKSRGFLTFSKVGDETMPILFIKEPIINPSTNNVVGLLYQGYEYNHFDIQLHINKMFDKQASMSEMPSKHNKIKLTNRQKQVIYFFMASLGSQEIAEHLSKINHKTITKSTVDSIFNQQLYQKFKVFNRVQLHDKLLALGYNSFVPDTFISPSVSHGSKLIII